MAVAFPVVSLADAERICGTANFLAETGQKDCYAIAIAKALRELSVMPRNMADARIDQYSLYNSAVVKELHTFDQVVSQSDQSKQLQIFEYYVGMALFSNASVSLASYDIDTKQISSKTNLEWQQFFHHLPRLSAQANPQSLPQLLKSIWQKILDFFTAICAFFISLLTCKQEGAEA